MELPTNFSRLFWEKMLFELPIWSSTAMLKLRLCFYGELAAERTSGWPLTSLQLFDEDIYVQHDRSCFDRPGPSGAVC